ncbi:MAG TPA: hypothetical protein VFI23_14735 [Rhizomicrobium sp.]|nr:hypothetical protein [Rhizomicrobium sp.]
MKIAVAILAAYVAALSSQAQAQTILRCTGFNKQLKGTIVHYVTIDDTGATLDEQPYSLKTSVVYYILDRPGQSMRINRTDGSYIIMGNSPSAINDWSRPEDQGCIAVKSKF